MFRRNSFVHLVPDFHEIYIEGQKQGGLNCYISGIIL